MTPVELKTKIADVIYTNMGIPFVNDMDKSKQANKKFAQNQAREIMVLLAGEGLVYRQTLIEDFTRIADNQLEDYGSPYYQAADHVREMSNPFVESGD